MLNNINTPPIKGGVYFTAARLPSQFCQTYSGTATVTDTSALTESLVQAVDIGTLPFNLGNYYYASCYATIRTSWDEAEIFSIKYNYNNTKEVCILLQDFADPENQEFKFAVGNIGGGGTFGITSLVLTPGSNTIKVNTSVSALYFTGLISENATKLTLRYNIISSIN